MNIEDARTPTPVGTNVSRRTRRGGPALRVTGGAPLIRPSEGGESFLLRPEAAERYRQGFRAGYNRLDQYKRAALRSILSREGLRGRRFYDLLNGRRTPRVDVAATVEGAFRRLGIEDPWGPSSRSVHVPVGRNKKRGGYDGYDYEGRDDE